MGKYPKHPTIKYTYHKNKIKEWEEHCKIVEDKLDTEILKNEALEEELEKLKLHTEEQKSRIKRGSWVSLEAIGFEDFRKWRKKEEENCQWIPEYWIKNTEESLRRYIEKIKANPNLASFYKIP